MDRRLLRPKWVLATLVVLLMALVFVLLGFWQLGRLDATRTANAVGERSAAEAPVELDQLLAESGDDYSELENRPVFASGLFDVDNEVLVRSQVYRGTAGFHVITPLIKDDGDAVLVNRGWVPLTMDTVPVDALPVPSEGSVAGWVHTTQTRPSLGPRDAADGRLVAVSRVDIDRIQEQVGYPLEPVYMVMESSRVDELPVPLSAPEFENEGPHLAYALQWFGFTLVLLIGYFFLVRKQLRTSS